MNIDEWLSSIGLTEYSPVFHANDVDMDAIGSLTSDDLKELGIASLGHRKKLLEEIQKIKMERSLPAGAPAPEQPVEQPPLEGGMWFNTAGSFYTVEHSDDSNAPMFALAGFVNKVMPYQPKIASWITNNYPQDKTKLAKFWKDLSIQMMVHAEWYLAWRGLIYGNNPEKPVLYQALRQMKTGVDDLNWPREATVHLVDINNPSEGEECTWGELLSPPRRTENC